VEGYTVNIVSFCCVPFYAIDDMFLIILDPISLMNKSIYTIALFSIGQAIPSDILDDHFKRKVVLKVVHSTKI
jgi:hypothetical protein